MDSDIKRKSDASSLFLSFPSYFSRREQIQECVRVGVWVWQCLLSCFSINSLPGQKLPENTSTFPFFSPFYFSSFPFSSFFFFLPFLFLFFIFSYFFPLSCLFSFILPPFTGGGGTCHLAPSYSLLDRSLRYVVAFDYKWGGGWLGFQFLWFRTIRGSKRPIGQKFCFACIHFFLSQKEEKNQCFNIRPKPLSHQFRTRLSFFGRTTLSSLIPRNSIPACQRKSHLEVYPTMLGNKGCDRLPIIGGQVKQDSFHQDNSAHRCSERLVISAALTFSNHCVRSIRALDAHQNSKDIWQRTLEGFLLLYWIL